MESAWMTLLACSAEGFSMVDPPLCRAVSAGSGAQYGRDDFQHHSNENGGRGDDGMVLAPLRPLMFLHPQLLPSID
jgi:hypothetical protein